MSVYVSLIVFISIYYIPLILYNKMFANQICVHYFCYIMFASLDCWLFYLQYYYQKCGVAQQTEAILHPCHTIISNHFFSPWPNTQWSSNNPDRQTQGERLSHSQCHRGGNVGQAPVIVRARHCVAASLPSLQWPGGDQEADKGAGQLDPRIRGINLWFQASVWITGLLLH